MDEMQQAALNRARSALDMAGASPAAGFLSGRFLKSLGLASNRAEAAQFAAAQTWLDAARIKAALSAGDVGSGELAHVLADFWDMARPLSVLGRLPGLMLRPFRQKSITPTSGGVAGWHAEGDAIETSGLQFAIGAGLHEHFVTALDVATKEALARTAGLDKFIGLSLAGGLAGAIDRAFLEPDNDGSGPAPKSVTHASNAVHIPTTGSPKCDIWALINAYAGDLSRAALIMHPRLSAGLAFSTTDWGSTRLGVTGGVVLGIPVVCSESSPLDSSGALITLLDIGALDAAGQVTALDSSDQGSIEMTTPPTGDSITPTAAQMVSLWQTGAVGFKASAAVDWKLRRTGGVVCVTGAEYWSLES